MGVGCGMGVVWCCDVGGGGGVYDVECWVFF